MITRRGLLKMIGGGIASMAALSGYAFAVEPLARLNVTRYSLTPPGWTPGLKLRVVALADIHACEPWMPASRIASICRQANDLGGDVTVLLGDYAAGMNFVTRYVHSSEWAKSLATLTAPLGVHAIMGNHDWWEDKTAQRNGSGPTFGHKALQDVGINVYSNRAVRLTGAPLRQHGGPFARTSQIHDLVTGFNDGAVHNANGDRRDVPCRRGDHRLVKERDGRPGVAASGVDQALCEPPESLQVRVVEAMSPGDGVGGGVVRGCFIAVLQLSSRNNHREQTTLGAIVLAVIEKPAGGREPAVGARPFA